MSERKVLNKYYPPDFDPTKIPKLKGPRNKTFNIRIMAPFNMRCNTCGEYVYKGKKFNSRKETVETENYLGLHIHRFYIKCPRCVAEIAFKTDPENTDYTLEAGATRNFEAAKTAMALAVKAQKEKEEEELNNPMKTLENRTKASRNEMERIENLEELREMNARYAKVDHESMLKLSAAYEAQLERLQDEEDEAVVSRAFGNERCKRLADDSDSDDESGGGPSLAKVAHVEKPTDLLLEVQPSEPSVSVTAAPSSSAAIETPPPAAPSMPAAPTSTKSRADPLRNLVVKPKAQSALKGLVVRKKPTSTEPAKNDDPKTENPRDSETRRGEIVSSKNDTVAVDKMPTTVVSVKTSGEPKGALSLLGNYSETDESD